MKVLIIEDEYALADAISQTLKNLNFMTTIKTDGEEGKDEALTNVYDVILLDIMLPSQNGFDILKELKEENIDAAILILTAKSELDDKLVGLNNGADDYLTKPFHMKELVARIQAIVRRKENIKDIDTLEFGDLILDKSRCELFCKSNNIKIIGKELDILELLMLNKKNIVKREILVNKIWGYDCEAEYNNVEVYITFIRRKLKILNSSIKIKAVRGIGYRMEEDDD